MSFLSRRAELILLPDVHQQLSQIEYYLDRRDPQFDAQKAQALFVCKEVQLLRERLADGFEAPLTACLSYDEKPGIQAIGATAPDLPPIPGKHSCISRDHFAPKHGSWLTMIESFCGKMARTMLRGIRVKSKEELKQRIELFLQEINQAPAVFR